LKNITLPWSSKESLCQDFVDSLPRNIESVEDVRSEHITEEFPRNFNKLKSLSIGEDIYSEIEMSNDNIQILRVNLRKYNFFFDPECTFFKNVTNGLSNLTNLQIICNVTRCFIDMDLHSIIDELKQLRVLHLERCGSITDYGVLATEVGSKDRLESLRTKRLYLYPECFFEADLIEKPISSLKKLEKLVLTGSKITDVGIVMGFRFGSTLKHLILGSKSDNVSDLGLHCLGANNPGLELFHGSFTSSEISTYGIENLRQRLPLIQSTQKFKFIKEIS